MTEKDLLHKRERKHKRRVARIKARTPEQEYEHLLSQIYAVEKGQEGVAKLYKPLLKKEEERHAREEQERGDG